MLVAMTQSVSQGGAMLWAWRRQQSKCGATFRNFEVPLGFADLQPGAVSVTLGGSVLEQPPHVLSSNIFQTLP